LRLYSFRFLSSQHVGRQALSPASVLLLPLRLTRQSMGIIHIQHPAIDVSAIRCRLRALELTLLPLQSLCLRVSTALDGLKAALLRSILLSCSAECMQSVASLPDAADDKHDRSLPGPQRLHAEALAELGAKCGEHGTAAIAAARWGAIGVWLMSMGRSDDHALSNPLPLASKAVYMLSRHDRACLGYPHHDGHEHVSPMDDLPSFAWEGIMQAGLETMTDWERAGCPHLNRERIQTVRLYVHASLRNAAERTAMADMPNNGREGPVESASPAQATCPAPMPQ
jgi:hypothetical protein